MSKPSSTRGHWYFPSKTLSQLVTMVAFGGLVVWAQGPGRGVRPGRLRGPMVAPLPWASPGWAVVVRTIPTLDDGIYAATPGAIDPRFAHPMSAGVDPGIIVSAAGRFAPR